VPIPRTIRSGLGPTFLLLALTTCGSPYEPPAEGAGRIGSWIVSGGVTRTYVLRLPPGYTSTSTWPLLIAFHGGGDTGAGFEQLTNLTALADQVGVIVVYPSGYGGSWAVGCDCTTADAAQIDDVKFTRDLIGQLEDSLAIDPDRVFVTGFSQGAQLVHRLACELADVIAGAASIEGTLHSLVAADCHPARPMPLLMMLATDDPAVRWDGQTTSTGRFYSADETLQFWLAQEACDTTPATTMLPDKTNDGTTVQQDRYLGCARGEVDFYTIQGGGHAWPGSPGPWSPANGAVCMDIDANFEVLAFMWR
jgi:polyhydroxybutyrate depolymerase